MVSRLCIDAISCLQDSLFWLGCLVVESRLVGQAWCPVSTGAQPWYHGFSKVWQTELMSNRTDNTSGPDLNLSGLVLSGYQAV